MWLQDFKKLQVTEENNEHRSIIKWKKKKKPSFQDNIFDWLNE